MHSNKVTATELTHVKWINKYLLFQPHRSVEYNNISETSLNLDFLAIFINLLFVDIFVCSASSVMSFGDSDISQ